MRLTARPRERSRELFPVHEDIPCTYAESFAEARGQSSKQQVLESDPHSSDLEDLTSD